MIQEHTMTNAHLLKKGLPPVVEVLIYILSIFSGAQLVKGNSVTCDVTSVEPLANTSITCHFPEDVSQTRRIVTVSHFKGNNYRDEEYLLECWWLSGKMDCAVSPGYKFNRIISRELTLEIPRVSLKHVGNYACKMSNMNPRHIKPCELKTTLVGRTMCDVQSIKDTTLTCYFPEDLSKNKTNFSVHHGGKGEVMSCVWKGDNLNCRHLPGYEFDNSVTDHAVIRIHNASEEQEGTYNCHVPGLGLVRYDSCPLVLEKVISSCRIPNVYEAEPTMLTCIFSVDVIATRRNITVVLFGDGDNKGVDITSCRWLKDKLNCTTASGYEFNNTVSNHIVIRVPQASRGHNGTYVCHVTGSEIKKFEPCNFIIKTGSPDGEAHKNVTLITGGIFGSIIFLITIAIIVVIVIRIRKAFFGNIVELPCTYRPRICNKISWTGECYIAQIKLLPEQADLLKKAPPRVFVAGPPGTGKTVVLLLMATEWLRNGNDVYILSDLCASLPVCRMLKRMLEQGLKIKKRVRRKPGKPQLLEISMDLEEDVEMAVDTLSQKAKGGSLYVIVDEVCRRDNFNTFCAKLLDKVSGLHLWASSYFHENAPDGWLVKYLTIPIRSPPDVVKEVAQDESITRSYVVKPYSERHVTDSTDGPPIIRLYHRGPGHPGEWPMGCVTCGCEVANILLSLHQDNSKNVTATSKGTASPSLQWRDMLLLYRLEAIEITPSMDMVKQLREAGIPVQVMTDKNINDRVMAHRDVVFVGEGHRVRGLERRVVVIVYPFEYTTRLYHSSRCMSQLIIVSTDPKLLQYD